MQAGIYLQRKGKGKKSQKEELKITSKSLAEVVELIEKLRSKMAITLNSGFKMPQIGLGVWRMEKQQVRDLIINAIKIGYRHFDCAGTLLLQPISSSFQSFYTFCFFSAVSSVDILIFSSILLDLF